MNRNLFKDIPTDSLEHVNLNGATKPVIVKVESRHNVALAKAVKPKGVVTQKGIVNAYRNPQSSSIRQFGIKTPKGNIFTGNPQVTMRSWVVGNIDDRHRVVLQELQVVGTIFPHDDPYHEGYDYNETSFRYVVLPNTYKSDLSNKELIAEASKDIQIIPQES